MHGLRCDPALLGWTRLLDEWVAGLTRVDGATETRVVSWDDPVQALETFAEALTRVLRFAYPDGESNFALPQADETFATELRGCPYRIAVDQPRSSSVEAVFANVEDWLDAALERAATRAESTERPVGVLLVAPRIEPGRASTGRTQVAEALVAKGRAIRCHGCAFSFPGDGELERYRHGDAEHPGVLLLVRAAD